MKKKIKKLGIHFFVTILLCFLSSQAFAEGPKVIKVVGKAEIHRPSKRKIIRISTKREISKASEKRVPVSVGEEIHPGDRIQVVGKGVVVIQKGKASIEGFVTDNSELNYLGKSFLKGVERFTVPKGLLRFKIKKGYSVDVKTPHLVASVRGTEFTTPVETNISTVSVVSGEVMVSDFKGYSVHLTDGSSISATKDGLTMAKVQSKGKGKGKGNDIGHSKNTGKGKGQGQGQGKGQGQGQGQRQGKGQGQGKGKGD